MSDQPTCSGCRKQHPGPQKTCQKCRDKVADRRKALKALGLCTVCKTRPSALGRTSCDECLRFSAKKRLGSVHSRISKGLCPQCGKKAKKRLCGSCRQKVRANQKRELKRRTAEEVCRYCRKAAVVPDKTGCRKCLDERANYSRTRMRDPMKHEEHRRKRDERYAAKIAAGLCIFCPEPAAPFVKCERHRGIEAARYQLKQIKQRAAAERAAQRQAQLPPAQPA